MKEVTFKFIGYIPIYIKILDNNHNTIYNDKTCNNIIKVCLERNKSYTLIARSRNRIIIKIFLIDDKTNKFIFSFYNYRIITFLLKDYYYNLPIKKGELILWPK